LRHDSDVDLVDFDVDRGRCDTGSPSVHLDIDDLLIFAAVEPIDGPGKILGAAGWCVRRTAALPVIGSMRFDASDVAALDSSGRLDAAILHEMGHVLGIGTLWNDKGLLQNASSGGSSLDTFFSGVNGILGFDEVGGLAYSGPKVPVENFGGAGTINTHWRESVLANELMTGFLNAGENPLSALTLRSLTDLGYVVDVASADVFTLMLALRASTNGRPTLPLGDDTYAGPQWSIDARGTIRRIR
jgi:hypothetical protein